MSILAVLVNTAITLRLFEYNYIFGSRATSLGWARTALYLMGEPEILRSKPQKHIYRTYLLSGNKYVLYMYDMSIYVCMMPSSDIIHFFPLAVHLGSRHTRNLYSFPVVHPLIF